DTFTLPFQIRNDSLETIKEVTHVYLFASQDSKIVPSKEASSSLYNNGIFSLSGVANLPIIPSPFPLPSFYANSVDAADGLGKQFRLQVSFAGLPPGAVEEFLVPFMFID